MTGRRSARVAATVPGAGSSACKSVPRGSGADWRPGRGSAAATRSGRGCRWRRRSRDPRGHEAPGRLGAAGTSSHRVLIADDQALVRAGFRMILEAQPDIRVVAEAADGDAAIRLSRRHAPDVVLMDVRMPGLDGLEATRRILDGVPGGAAPRVIVLTTFDLDEYVYAALQSGASGFLLKDVSPEQLVAAIRMVSVGDALLAPAITRRLVERYARPSGSSRWRPRGARDADGHGSARCSPCSREGRATPRSPTPSSSARRP